MEKKKDAESIRKKEYLFAVVDFLVQQEGVTKVDYFNQGYQSFDLTKTNMLATNIRFENVNQ